MTPTAHVLLVDQVADWEPGYLLVELNTGRFTGEPWKVLSVAATTEPVPTMGGLRWVPDVTLAELDPADSDLLVMPGGAGWQPGQEEPYVEVAARFLGGQAYLSPLSAVPPKDWLAGVCWTIDRTPRPPARRLRPPVMPEETVTSTSEP